MSYIPQVNDYVTWKNNIEGWVYFKSKDYITIEMNVKPKDNLNYEACSLHLNDRLLVLCYYDQWKELKYIKSRESIYDEETKNSMEMVGKGTGREGIEE
jgi:hypothetical protein